MTVNQIICDIDVKLDIFESFKGRLQEIYSGMDKAYEHASRGYGFECKGCRENCCETRFYHHTWAEYLYVIKGFRDLDKQQQQQIKKMAAAVDERHRRAEAENQKARVMCPLNKGGFCALYEYRPMICRMHGIPHELAKPGQKPVYGSGCELFCENYGNLPYVAFDRTPHYRKMAVLEQEFRRVLGITEKIRMTIAAMLLQT